MAITKATAGDDIWKTIFDTLNDNLTDPNPPDSGSRKWIWSSFPQGEIDRTLTLPSIAQDVAYPLIVISAPRMSWDGLTMRKKWVMTELDITAYSTKMSQSISIADSFIDLLETQRPTLRSLKLVMVDLDNVENDVEFRGEKKIHTRQATFTMRFSFKGTL